MFWIFSILRFLERAAYHSYKQKSDFRGIGSFFWGTQRPTLVFKILLGANIDSLQIWVHRLQKPLYTSAKLGII